MIGWSHWLERLNFTFARNSSIRNDECREENSRHSVINGDWVGLEGYFVGLGGDAHEVNSRGEAGDAAFG